ncbi:hypothetical protein NLU13_6081 [Sarocladium strictum]|uniref:Major facilitator superfamily (MFS) profile domain-containing protein n=1 Tax=Sarocladium strictum TaxID=5046 RepID=A0AA39GGT2_SARSR|nr:hypothetical protein NLU13_6081 [Sarocladium strictum]
MQALLQYRRIGAAAQAQLDRAAEKQDGSWPGPDSGSQHHVDSSVVVLEESPSPSAAHTPPPETGGGEASLGPVLTGVSIRNRMHHGDQVFVLGWAGQDDPLMPHNWSVGTRVGVTLQLALIGLVLTAASGIDATVLPQAASDLGVSQVAESLATGLYLAGMGIGCLVAGPFSETFGRVAVYGVALVIFMIFIMASALAPNFGAQITFRFLAGCCASTPLVCTGGSIADMFNSLEKTWSFPLYAIPSFMGPMLGAVMGAYIGPSTAVDWRWVEWTMLLASGLVLCMVLLCMPETYGPVLLQWKAAHYRRITGDDRFRCEHEIMDATLWSRLKVSMTRPFVMLAEPIILAMTLYITVIYIVLFTFLVGWPYIFEFTYGISQGLSNTIFVSMLIGTELNLFLVPLVYRMTTKRFGDGAGSFQPEIRLWYGVFGAAVAIPVSLFWLGWTNYASISIWSAVLAVALFGYGVMGIFLCVYMYIIDSYETSSASALTFVALVRYLAAGGMTAAGIPWYESMGTHYTLTVLACVAAALVPIPYLLYFYGHKLRSKSKYAVEY